MISTIEHVGEWRVAARAISLEGLFAQVARFVAGTAGLPCGATGPWERVVLEARDLDALLVDWANELIGRGEVDQRAYGETRALVVESGAGGAWVHAEIRGPPLVEWRSPLKAATYHQALVERAGSRWRAQLLFDV